ncbi:cytochrome c peroxidase [Litorivivens lipolytica]|uniref:Methylamine utilization protein MauG n=1 Tax=Litorivivens lipolytica TaxID=1524264 RepID=A0A7W4W4D3_9GAMM|nr:cytochrome c peroxidase [Litorivivens lipolytica]MBB3047231.1 cytochrome c peroxidase [Litorivivens lipolytica]
MKCLRWLAVFSLIAPAVWAEDPQDDWQLSEVCPPGFVLEGESCKFSSLYSEYPSLQDAGMGGLKVGLPEPRDGFKPAEIDLGRLLFFDPVLSGDGSVSCASCHQPDKGFTDGRALSRGIHGQIAERSAPSLWNVGFLDTLFWDGRAKSLEEQMLGPLYAEHEMGNTPEQLMASLSANPTYVKLFKQAFPERGLTLDTVYIALAAFESSLISLNSRYDLYAHGFHDVLNQNEIEGMNIFRSFVARCGECHTPPLFTNRELAVLGTPEPTGRPLDIGAEGPTGDRSLRGGFKVPTLRNIELTAPYMHSGRFKTLRETVEFYTKGRGHAVPEGEHLSIHWHIWEPKLTDAELDRLVDFLLTLTDQSFMPVIPERVPSGLSVVDALNHSEITTTPVAMGDTP